eukprot:286742_1
MRLTIDLLRYVAGHINTICQREISLRGYQIPAIENLGILEDAYDCIDLSDNSIVIMDNFPEMKRLIVLLLHNNKIRDIAKGLGQLLPNLENPMLTNNKIEKLSQLDALSEFDNLLRLNLVDNPVCKQDGYRLYVIARCPKLKHLDFQKIKQSERDEAERIWGNKLKSTKKSNTKQKVNKAKNKPKQKKANAMDVDEDVNEKETKEETEAVRMNGHGDKTVTNDGDIKLSPTQIEIIKKAINAATTNAEFEKLEKILKAGRMPEGDWMKLAQLK